MRRLGAWRWQLALLAAWGAAATVAADEPARGAAPWNNGGLLRGWFGRPEAASVDKPVSPAEAMAAKTPSAVEDAAAERARHEAALLRRQAVCARLLEIAFRNNDPELERQAEELQNRAWALYTQRTANLSSAGRGLELDEGVLDRKLGGDRAAPSGPERPAAGREAGARATLREEK